MDLANKALCDCFRETAENAEARANGYHTSDNVTAEYTLLATDAGAVPEDANEELILPVALT